MVWPGGASQPDAVCLISLFTCGVSRHDNCKHLTPLSHSFVMSGTWEQSHPITLYKAHIKIIDKRNILGIVQSPSTNP